MGKILVRSLSFLPPPSPSISSEIKFYIFKDKRWNTYKKVQDGANKIPVGQVIAILAEEGDDLASIEVPKDLGPEDSSAPSSSSSEKKEAAPEKKEEKAAPKEEKKTAPAPEKKEEPSHGNGHKVVKHSKPLFPSVSRLYVPCQSVFLYWYWTD
jgi:hypothetical protein